MTTQRVVIVKLECKKCEGHIEVECEHSAGFQVMDFYHLACPHCGCRLHRMLPGDMVDILPGLPTAAAAAR